MNTAQKKVYTIFVMCLSLLTYVAVNKASAYTLKDAITATQTNNNKLLAAQQNLESERVATLRAYGDFLPEVAIKGSVARSANIDTELNSPARTAKQKSGTLSARQELFSGGRSIEGVKRAREAVRIAEAAFHHTLNEIILMAITAYENVLLNRQLYQISINNQQSLQKHLETAEIKFKAGEVTRTDVSMARSQLAEATTNKEKAFGEMTAAESNFFHVIGQHPPKELQNVDIKKVYIPSNIDEFFALAQSTNPAILGAQSRTKFQKYDLGVSMAGMLPTVSLEVEATARRTKVYKGYHTADNSNTIALAVDIPIIERGRTIADIRDKRHRVRKSEFDLENMRGNVADMVVRIWTKYQVAKSAIESSNEALKAAEDAATGVMEEYNVGAKTTFDVMQAELRLLNTQQNLKKTEQELVISAFEVHYLLGDLNNLDFGQFTEQPVASAK